MTDSYPYEITVNYETPLFKRAAMAYLKSLLMRNKRVVGVLLAVAGVLFLILLLLLGVMILNGCPLPRLSYPLQLMIVALLVLVVLVPLMYVFLYFQTVKNCEKLASKMSDTNIHMGFGQQGFRFQSELATSEVNWTLFYQLQKAPDIWLLFPNQMTFYMLPVEVLSEELQGFIQERLRENGIAIKEI